MYFKTQKFLVAGMSRSGIAAAKLLLSRGAKVFVYDDSANTGVAKNNVAEAVRRGAVEVTNERLAEAEKTCDVLVLSPGIPIDHPLPVRFKKSGKKIMGEMELGSLFLPCPSIAVTGTNGKTTTVAMIEHLLKSSGRKAVACGNVGTPLCAVVDGLTPEHIAVVEVSSFQLESLSSLRPHVCVELNITEDHLNRHYTMDNYIFLKEKLMQNSRESEFVVLNADDEIVNHFERKTRAKVLKFSLRGEADGAYLLNGDLYYRGERLLSEEDLSVSGAHNTANALAAICAVKPFSLTSEEIKEGLSTFEGIRHRLERVAAVGGVEYINDSKATNADATVKAIESTKGETVLLLGGRDKGYDYDGVFVAALKSGRIVHAVVYGENKNKILSSALKTGFFPTSCCNRLSDGVKLASAIAKSGQTVLLSPASSSFDEFDGYESRGDFFCSLVYEMGGEKVVKEEQETETAKSTGTARAIKETKSIEETKATGAGGEALVTADADGE